MEIPQGNWYCDDCFETSDESDDDTDELEDLNNDIEEEMDMVQLAETRLRARQPQPQILRTMQSERIRNAILARMSLRSARAAFGEGPSTSAPVVSRAKPVRKRRTTRRRKVKRRARTEVVEYDVDGSDKFAMRTRRVARKSRRKKRKVAKTSKRKVSKPSAGSSTGFKSSNPNVHELQRGRQRAGLSNFNIFQPTNELDYVPDEYENIEDSGIEESAENSSGSVLTQAIIGLRNPQRRNMIIKNRVLQNCTTTSSVDNLLDTIMQDQNLFGPGSIGNKFAVEKSSGKLLFVGKNEVKVKQSSGVEETSPSECPPSNEDNNSEAGQTNPSSSTKGNETAAPSEAEANSSPVGRCSNDRDESQNISGDQTNSNTKESPDDKKKKPKKLAIDMFDESSSTQETTDDCPNFSIYDSVDASVDPEGSSSFQMRPNVYDEENVDLVQLSDNEQNHESSEEALPAIVASQPASPDLDPEDELVPERSYTPPIAQKTSDDAPDKDEHERKKKDRDSRRNRKRELERYNVRDRLKERSPVKIKDKFGRNRSRSRSSSRKKQARRRSRSVSKERHRKSKSHERYRKSRSFSRSRSRRRTPSIDHDRKKTKPHKEKQTKVNRRTRSRSLTPRHHKPTTPDRRARSRSKKPKKRKHCDHNKEKPSTLTKEVFTSGQNILVSVNFNNQEEKSAPKRLKNLDQLEPKEIVDITARKKITISSKPVAIIDLARSPFRELTPEYQTNVIELSDSEGEEARERPPPKSPDSTLSSKLYDPFDILNSPPNENVTSSQNSAAQLMLQKQQEKVQEPVKTSVSYNKNVMAMATNSLFFNEENLVSSSSSLLMNDKQIPLLFTSSKLDAHQTDKNISKNETVPMDIAESPYSPGHEYDDAFPNHDDNGGAKSPKGKQAKGVNKGGNIFDELFGSSTPPGLDKAKNSKKGEKQHFNYSSRRS